MIRHLVIVSLVCAFCFQAAACKTFANLAGSAASFAGAVVGPQPQQAHTLGEAIISATLVTRLTDSFVDAGKLTATQLRKLDAASDGLHAAIDTLEKANANGQSLSFGAFNAALSAWKTYTATLPKS